MSLTHTVGLLLAPDFPVMALGCVGEVLHQASLRLSHERYAVELLTLDGLPVQSGCGLALQPRASLAACGPLTALWVAAREPLPPRDARLPLLVQGLHRLRAQGVALGGLDGGGLWLAQSGVAAGRRLTADWPHIDLIGELDAHAIASTQLYELSDDLLSSGPGSAMLEVLIAWMARRHGERLGHELAAHFALERLRQPQERPRQAHNAVAAGSGKLSEALSLMEANLSEPLPTEDVARLVGVSRRQLERLFKQHLDSLPSRWYLELRLSRAQRMLQHTGQSILQIALACGFTSGPHFSNAYRARFGCTPRDERAQRAAAWRSGSSQTAPDTSDEPTR